MRTYRIPVWWMVGGTLNIKADSLQDAIKEAEDSHIPAVVDQCYIDESFRVDWDGAMEMNEPDEESDGPKTTKVL